ncbi:transposable element Tcb2 transposase [Trichonephila clavipes]|nr:transposable element Tcb2 transposase [Trichonephila clavipes]
MSFTRRPGSGRPRHTNHREDHRIVRIARVQPTASSPTIQAQVAPSLGSLCLLEPYEGTWQNDVWDRCAHYTSISLDKVTRKTPEMVLPTTNNHIIKGWNLSFKNLNMYQSL